MKDRLVRLFLDYWVFMLVVLVPGALIFLGYAHNNWGWFSSWMSN